MFTLKDEEITVAERLNVAQIRLTAFYNTQEGLKDPSWWSYLTAAEPENRNSRPNTGEFQETGLVGGRLLLLSVQARRVDWIILPPQPTAENPLPSRWAGSLPEVLPFFCDLMDRWLGIAPTGIVRLAFGLIVDEPATSKIEAYEKLSPLLPSIKLDPKGSSDFIYQINRPSSSKVIEGLLLNRLGKWTATAFVPLQLAINPGFQVAAQSLGDGEFTCRVEIDVNSGLESPELARSITLPLFEEITKSAIEIALNGDVIK